MKIYGKIGAFLLLAICVAIVSCNKKFDKLLPTTAYSDSTNTYKAPKVLYIIVDGARGWSVRDANAPNINSLIGKSIYSWYSVSDSLGNDGNGWADMLTGVTKAKHKVIDNTFAGNNLTQYPSIFSRIKTISPNSRLAAFSASAAFKTNLTAGADVSQTFAADSAVRSAVVTELGNDASTLVVGEFNSVNTAGATYGYDNSFPQYKAAVLQFDQYLGQMLTALKARKNYAKENWLVIVTSNHGGPATIPAAQNDNTILSYPIASTFTIIYNDSYTTKLIDKPYTGNKYTGSFCRFYANPTTAANGVYPTSYVKAVTDVNRTTYNFGDTTSFTIEFKVKMNSKGGTAPYTYNWPIVMGKRLSKTQKSTNGWAINREGNSYRLIIGNPTTNFISCYAPASVTDGNWHSLAFVVYTMFVNGANHRYMRSLLDGVNNNARPTGDTNIDNFVGIDDPTAPLELGVVPTDLTNTFDGFISDIRIWKANLPDGVISQYSCNTTIDNTHPFYPYLIGYWPGNDGSGTVIHDQSIAHNDFNIQVVGTAAPLQWVAANDIICPPSTTFLSSLVPRNVDMPRQILSWLTIAPPDSWGLNGRVWLNN
ncbi:MAG: alkaline phosphatase family protein [Mucilaginibacter sp.]|uniref:alkaline phosphatase family protein n=1 Tax=Mucilaginibacter sp. TaxID=1882438 RepID=UPI00326436F4